MKTLSPLSEPTSVIDTKSRFMAGSCWPRSQSNLQQLRLNLEAKSRLGGPGVQSVRRAAELKSVPLRPAPARQRLQDPDAHGRQRGAGSVYARPAGAIESCWPGCSRVNPALRPNPSFKSGPATAGSVSLARGTRAIFSVQAYAACLHGPL
jgi:hypothetical protein